MLNIVSYMAIVLLIQVSMYGICRRKGHLPWIKVVVKDATCSVHIITFMIIVVYPNSARGSGEICDLITAAPIQYLIAVIRDFYDMRCRVPSSDSHVDRGSPADVTITFFSFFAIFLLEVVGM